MFCTNVVSDPLYQNLSLGTVSSVLEIELIRRLQISRPELHYYYLGYYIRECPKMAYKARLQPSELLDDELLNWHEFKVDRD